MRLAVLNVVALLVLAFAGIEGVLMCVSPRCHAAFWRWYTRQESGGEFGTQMESRIAGIIIVALCMFIGWKIVEKISEPLRSSDAQTASIPAMTENASWFGVLAGIITIAGGVYVLLQTASVVSWLKSRGLQHSFPTVESQRQVIIMGVLFVLGGLFFVVVSTINH
jgi:uncharacterized membrane protein